MAADATITVAVDAAMESIFLEIIPAAVFSGSSVLCACAAITDVAMAVDAETMVIPAGSLSYCFCCAVAADVATVVDADLIRGQRVISSAFFPAVRGVDCFWAFDSPQAPVVCGHSQDPAHKTHFHL